MKRTFILAAGLMLATGIASAQVSATGTFSFTGSSPYNYTLHLTNTGANSIDVLWFGWIPDINFLVDIPSVTSSPAGWTSSVTHVGPGDGYGIQWITSTAPLAAGGSLNFGFTSTTTPTQMTGQSPLYGGFYQQTLSYVYQGAPYPSASPFGILTFAQAAPEPASLATIGLGAIALIRRRKLRS